MKNNKVLYFFTSRYPYGSGETFIENEIDILCEHFNKVYIFPNEFKDILERSIPDNAEVIRLPSIVLGLSSFEKINFNKGLAIFSLLELIRNPISSETYRYRIAYFKQVYSRFWNLKSLLKTKDPDNIVFYTYWFEEWASVLSELKRKEIIDSFISRAHGFDIYEERRKDGFIPFRQLQLKMVTKVYCASMASMNYLKGKYNDYQSKIDYAHLGVYDHGLNPFSESETITIISVSNIIPLKQVTLIPEVLNKFNFNIKWIHFGDGIDMILLKERVKLLPENVNVELKGRVKNSDLINFYKRNSVNFFLHLSLTEGGVPVSIQEAMSFGIPVVAFNVGGVSEILNKNTGLLLKNGIKVYEISDEINKKLNIFSSDKFRKNLRKEWGNNFFASYNYTLFTKSLVK